MLITLSSEIQQIFSVSTPWGEEKVICFYDHLFVRTETYKFLDEAIAECQRDQHSGFYSIVVKEPEGASLWCILPNVVDANLRKLRAGEEKRETIALESATPAKRAKSWLNLVMHLTQNPTELIAVH
jgi:hypothetical protein